MSILPIQLYGSSVLREKAVPVEKITDDLINLIEDMRKSLAYHQGIGLAANQIGVSRSLFLADGGDGMRVFINPRIIESDGSAVAEEGCLSLPDIYVDVRRKNSLLVEYLDEDENIARMEADGLWARVIQHEYDHL
ncbi:MAG: peptide deformylase, partial [Candidatus Auribacterota bacterium]|nr:peptide deformylase [Candidatus Auribacterota bacterium]